MIYRVQEVCVVLRGRERGRDREKEREREVERDRERYIKSEKARKNRRGR